MPVTGREIGFGNLMPLSGPITLGNPTTAFGKAIKKAITPPNEEDLSIAEECNAHVVRLKDRAASMRERIIEKRHKMAETHDGDVARWLAEEITDLTEKVEWCDMQAAVWADEAKRWTEGKE